MSVKTIETIHDALVIECKPGKRIAFEHLCPKCVGRVADLLA